MRLMSEYNEMMT